MILVILADISMSWLASEEFRLHILRFIFYLCQKLKRKLFVLFDTSSIASMLGWFLYFKIDLKTGLLILLETGSHLVYSGIVRLGTILKKKVLKTGTASCSFEIMSLLPIKVIKMIFLVDNISFQTKMAWQFPKRLYYLIYF